MSSANSNGAVQPGALHVQVAHSPEQHDDALLRAWARFQVIEQTLDRLVDADAEPPEQELLSLHSQWTQTVLHASRLPAHTIEGLRAKAAMLIAVLNVSLGVEPAPHELLADSLGRDLATAT